MKKLYFLFLLVSASGAFSANILDDHLINDRNEMNFTEFIVEQGGLVKDYVGGGSCHANCNYNNASDGMAVSTNPGLRWLGTIVPSDIDLENYALGQSTYLSFRLPQSCAVKLSSYTVHRLTIGDFWSPRSPTAWVMWGVTEAGVTNLISSVEGQAWATDESEKTTGESRVVSVDDVQYYREFIWVPTASNSADASLNVGLMELELMIAVEGMPGFNLVEWMRANQYEVANYVSGSGESSFAFDGVFAGGADNLVKRWLGRITSDEATTAYLRLDVPSDAFPDGLYPLGYRISRLAVGANRFAMAPDAWKFYGVTKAGEKHLLSTVGPDTLGAIYEKTWHDNASETPDADDDPESFGFTGFVNTNSVRYVSFLWVPTSTSVFTENPDAEINVGLMELEIFVDDVTLPVAVNLRDQMVASGCVMKNYVVGRNNFQGNYHGYHAFDGVTSTTADKTAAQWMATMTADASTTADLEVTVPSELYPIGCKLKYYRFHRMSAGWQYNLRAPQTWTLYGVTPDGVTHEISTVSDALSWKRTTRKGLGSDPSFVTISDLPRDIQKMRFTKFIWVPASNYLGTTSRVSGMEFQLFVDEARAEPGTVIIIR